jgi:hypothetical protein
MSVLDEVGAITPGYEHRSKVVHPAPAVEAGGAVLKWYDIAEGERPIPRDVAALARRGLAEATGRDALAGELGFVILHRCGDDFYFLLISTWRNENELWETVWAKPGADSPAFAPWPLDGGHHPTFCVWELRAVCHEQAAWSRYLRSPRRANDMQAYLEDTYEGTTV